MDTVKVITYLTILGVTVYIASYLTSKIKQEITQEVEH